MLKKYVVRLSDEERGICQDIVKNLKVVFPTISRH